MTESIRGYTAIFTTEDQNQPLVGNTQEFRKRLFANIEELDLNINGEHESDQFDTLKLAKGVSLS